jgi:aspartyl-tRNA(Asn)/glutamyl-tRNA(Gln) amidotransferase subunit A
MTKNEVRARVENFKKIIGEKDKEIHAVLGYFSDALIEKQICLAENLIETGKATALTGKVVGVKDNIMIEGEIATAGSKYLGNYVSAYTSSVMLKLLSEGVIPLVRTNMDEFAMGSSTENSAYGITRNPIDPSRVPGGSSGGSAALLAYGGVDFALGSDTGGSVRQPASFTGLIGLKPTYGSVSRYGLMAMGSSLDQIGPFAKTASDAKEIFEAISFNDSHDATSLTIEERVNKTETLKKKIGVPKSFIFNDNVDKKIQDKFQSIIDDLAKDHEIVDIDIEELPLALSAYYIVCPAEVSSNMARYDGIRYGMQKVGENINDTFINSRTEGLGDEVRRRILLGTYVLSSGYHDAYYNKAMELRNILRKAFAKTFETVDVIMTPMSPILPWKFGEKSDPIAMYLADIFSVTANMTGNPAISVPAGTVAEGEVELPFGVQFTADNNREDTLFTYASRVEVI